MCVSYGDKPNTSTSRYTKQKSGAHHRYVPDDMALQCCSRYFSITLKVLPPTDTM